MRMSADLERMGDLARHVAKVARLRYPESAVPADIRATILQMGQVAERIVAKCGSGHRRQGRRGRQDPRARRRRDGRAAPHAVQPPHRRHVEARHRGRRRHDPGRPLLRAVRRPRGLGRAPRRLPGHRRVGCRRGPRGAGGPQPPVPQARSTAPSHEPGARCAVGERHTGPRLFRSVRPKKARRLSTCGTSDPRLCRCTGSSAASGGGWRMDAGAEEEFRRFVQARWHALVRTAYLLTGDRGRAEDLVQQTLVKVHRRWTHIASARVALRLHPGSARQRVRVVVAAPPGGRVPRRRAGRTQTGPPATRMPRTTPVTSWPAPCWRCPRGCGRSWCCATSTTCPRPTPPHALGHVGRVGQEPGLPWAGAAPHGPRRHEPGQRDAPEGSLCMSASRPSCARPWPPAPTTGWRRSSRPLRAGQRRGRREPAPSAEPRPCRRRRGLGRCGHRHPAGGQPRRPDAAARPRAHRGQVIAARRTDPALVALDADLADPWWARRGHVPSSEPSTDAVAPGGHALYAQDLTRNRVVVFWAPSADPAMAHGVLRVASGPRGATADGLAFQHEQPVGASTRPPWCSAKGPTGAAGWSS